MPNSGPARGIRLGELCAAIAILAGAFAAFRGGEHGWLQAAYLVTGCVLLLATLQARLRPGRPGVFWFGFAAFGWAHLLEFRADGQFLPYTHWWYLALDWLERRGDRVGPVTLAIDRNDVDFLNHVISLIQVVMTYPFAAMGGLIARIFARERPGVD
ncbi:MAG: hypothetical protein U0800_27100 [Isosphaeraceae bacterium]